MSYTLKDFLNNTDFPGQQLLTDLSISMQASLEITNISVIEPPVENFVREKELVLSTAIGCYHDSALLQKFISEIYEQGASALVLSIEEENYSFPQEIINYCNSIRFPLIRIPWEYRFSEIVESVIHAIQFDSQHELSFWETLQNDLLKAFLRGEGLDKASSLIRGALQCSSVSLENSPVHTEQLFADSKQKTDYLLKISTSHKVFGYLLIRNYDPEVYHIEKFEQYLSTPLNLWFDREQTISNTKYEMVDEFIWKLANGYMKSEEAYYIKARNLGIQLGKFYICIVGKFYRKTAPNDTRYIHEWIAHNLDHIYNHLMNMKKNTDRQLLWSIQQDILLFYYENTNTTSIEDINLFIDQIEAFMKHISSNIDICWGISPLVKETENFESSFKEASLLSEICFIENSGVNRYQMKDASCYLLLDKSRQDKQTQHLAEKILEPLFQYKEEKGIDLYEVLKCYLSTGGNVSETARLLYIHRQTLIYQLKKAEELLNMTFDKHNNLFLLEVCCKILNVSALCSKE